MTARISDQARAEIMRTRETHPRMRYVDLKALADKHGISVGYAQMLRKRHADRKGLARARGRTTVLDEAQERELLILLLLQREVSNAALAVRFGTSASTFWRFKAKLLCQPRTAPQIDLPRLLQSIEGARE